MGRLNKKEFIDKFGEEAWEEVLAKQRIANKKWRETHLEEAKAATRKWRETNKEVVKDNRRKYYQENKEKELLQSKMWYFKKMEENPNFNKEQYQLKRDYNLERVKKYYYGHQDERAEYRKNYNETHQYIRQKYREEHREELNELRRQYRRSFNGRAKTIVNGNNGKDREKGFDTSNNVNSEWVIDNIFSSKCVYCGDSDWRHLGCDRIDNSKPHTAENCVPCCFICNLTRNDSFTHDEFKEYRKLHPRACDIPKAPAIQLSETGAIKKRTIN